MVLCVAFSSFKWLALSPIYLDLLSVSFEINIICLIHTKLPKNLEFDNNFGIIKPGV